MTTSVCMGIYNGEKYIEQQLQSILKQSKAADEVILCDDGSTDNTIAIVERFIEDNHLEDIWKLYCNRENKGYPANFYYAMSLCKGDVVFLADQDDIWHVDKIKKMCQVFQADPAACSVCCKFGLVDGNENRIHTLMQPTVSKETADVKNISIDNVFYKCEWPGMVMAYRRDWYDKRITEWSNTERSIYKVSIPHDFLIAAWAAEDKGFVQMDAELAWHRRHENNVGGEEHRLSRLLNKQRKLDEIDKYYGLLQAFQAKNILHTQEGQRALERKKSVMCDRYKALQSGKIPQVLRCAWKYKEQTRAASVICDLIITVID